MQLPEWRITLHLFMYGSVYKWRIILHLFMYGSVYRWRIILPLVCVWQCVQVPDYTATCLSMAVCICVGEADYTALVCVYRYRKNGYTRYLHSPPTLVEPTLSSLSPNIG